MKFYQIVLALLLHDHKDLSVLTGAVKYDDTGSRNIDLDFFMVLLYCLFSFSIYSIIFGNLIKTNWFQLFRYKRGKTKIISLASTHTKSIVIFQRCHLSQIQL